MLLSTKPKQTTSSDSDSEFFLGTIFYEDSNEESVPGFIEESDNETESDDNDDEDTELVEPMGIKQVNANECDDTGTPDGPEQNNNTDNQGDMHTFTIEDSDDYDDDWYIDLETNGSDVLYKIDTGAQVNVLPLNVY